MKVLLAGGGTAGHINPALAIAGYIKNKRNDAEFLFIGIIASGGNPLAAAAAGLLVNARHIPFGVTVRDLVGKRAHEHDVDAKGLIRLGAQLVNLVAKPVGVFGVSADDLCVLSL